MTSALGPGRKLGHFRLERPLARGGMGAVFLAIDEQGGPPVALKVILDEIKSKDVIRARFDRELRLAGTVRHPNVVPVLGSGIEDDGIPWLATEYLDGGSLHDLIRSRGTLPWREACRIAAGVARGLSAIHGAGLIHRDVKPANVLLDRQGTPRITDFGLVRRAGPNNVSIDLTKTGQAIGTFTYMAPEQADNAKHVDARADLYALGASLFELLTGRPPFLADGMALVRMHMEVTPTRPSLLQAGIPPEVDAIVLRLLAKEPEDRGPPAADVAAELDALAASSQAPAAAGPRTGLLIAIALAVGLSVGGVAVAFALRARDPSPPAPSPTPETPAKPTAPATPPRPKGSGPPTWWNELLEAKRAHWPLPRGIVAGENRGEYVNEKDGSVLVWVPRAPGQTDGFFIGKYEVSIIEYTRFADATGYKTTAEQDGRSVNVFSKHRSVEEFPKVAGMSFRKPDGPDQLAEPRWPAVHMTLKDARAYCDWAGLRLPLDREWVAAAQPTKGSRYPWGDDLTSKQGRSLANLGGRGDGYARLAPVDAFPDGASAVGALNMCGNAREIVTDEGPSDSVLPLALMGTRGGSWVDEIEFEGLLTSPTNRWDLGSMVATSIVGFRVARDPR
jgi:serine/threonine protein kinase/formylglycine-generating enzyme required for sulfatase activity